MNQTITRRLFLQGASISGAALAVLPTRVDLAASAERQRPITLALAGCAHSHAPGYIQRLQGSKNVKVKYVWDPDPERASKWAAVLNARAVADDDLVWTDPQVQAVIICSQTNLHRRLVLAAAKARKHLFVEKPMGMTGCECREMADAIEQAKVLFTTGYGMRISRASVPQRASCFGGFRQDHPRPGFRLP